MEFRMSTVISDHRFERFVEGLDDQTIAQVRRMVGLLKRYGSSLEMPYSKALGGGLFELRIRGRREVRVIYAYRRGAYVLLHGFIKKMARIPQREMKTAKARLQSFDCV
jgi:phage-related protein